MRLVYDAQPLARAWRSMELPALGVLAAMALSIIVLFRWLMVCSKAGSAAAAGV